MMNIQATLKARRGLRSLIARELGITHGAVYQWDKIPVERVIDVERVTGISRHDLRPDIYPEAAQ